MAVQTPRMTGHVVIKTNQGEGESPREEETTADEDGEDGEREVSEPSEPSEAPAMPCVKVTKVKAQRSTTK